MLDHHDSTVCIHDPGYEVDVWIGADAKVLQMVWIGKLTLETAIECGQVTVGGPRRLTRAFPAWFSWSPFHHLVAAGSTRTPSS